MRLPERLGLRTGFRDGRDPPEDALECFDFVTATLERKRTGLFRGRIERVIERRQAQGRRWVERLTDDRLLELVAIPGDSFQLGFPPKPQDDVRLAPFWMGRYPITQAQWRIVTRLPRVNRALDPDPSDFKGDTRPVELLSWFDAVEFCDRLAAHTHRDYRLPTEVEWEYACRAGTTTPFHFGQTISTDLANYNGAFSVGSGLEGEFRKQTTPVGSFPANAFGLYDMHGNVWEWCQADGEVMGGELRKPLCGGAWSDGPWHARSGSRHYLDSTWASDSVGFRVVCAASWAS